MMVMAELFDPYSYLLRLSKSYHKDLLQIAFHNLVHDSHFKHTVSLLESWAMSLVHIMLLYF